MVSVGVKLWISYGYGQGGRCRVSVQGRSRVMGQAIEGGLGPGSGLGSGSGLRSALRAAES